MRGLLYEDSEIAVVRNRELFLARWNVEDQYEFASYNSHDANR